MTLQCTKLFLGTFPHPALLGELGGGSFTCGCAGRISGCVLNGRWIINGHSIRLTEQRARPKFTRAFRNSLLPDDHCPSHRSSPM